MLERLNHAYPRTRIITKQQIWRNVFLVVLLVLSLIVITDGLGIYFYPRMASLNCRADTALVMGAAQYNGLPSPAFKRRLDRALELFNAGCVTKVVVTGGKMQGDNYSEGFSGAKYLNQKGIDKTNISYEETSTTSYENLNYARALVPKKEITLVTDDYHSYRSSFLARGLGYKVEIAPVFTKRKRQEYKLVFSELVKLTAYHLGVIK